MSNEQTTTPGPYSLNNFDAIALQARFYATGNVQPQLVMHGLFPQVLITMEPGDEGDGSVALDLKVTGPENGPELAEFLHTLANALEAGVDGETVVLHAPGCGCADRAEAEGN